MDKWSQVSIVLVGIVLIGNVLGAIERWGLLPFKLFGKHRAEHQINTAEHRDMSCRMDEIVRHTRKDLESVKEHSDRSIDVLVKEITNLRKEHLDSIETINGRFDQMHCDIARKLNQVAESQRRLFDSENAMMDGLIEIGVNGPVKTQRSKNQEYINTLAFRQEDN